MMWSAHDLGCDVLGGGVRGTIGPRGRIAARRKHMSVMGVAPVSWDKHNHYDEGTVVYADDGNYYRAVRDIDPPLIPAFMSGEVPGQSEAWKQTSQAAAYPGTDVRGESAWSNLGRGRLESPENWVIGFFDIGASQRQMNALKQVTIGIAKVLLRYGQQAINKAITGAKQPWYRADLPGDTNRKEVQGHLDWHQNAIASSSGDTQAVYGSGDDLKKWVMQAYIEENAVEEGNAEAAKLWSLAWDDWKDMWSEIAVELAKLPKEIAQTIATLPGHALEAVTGVPMWAWYAGSVLLVGLLGYTAYKIATGPMGAAVAGAATHHYLGRR